jgi:hypothetical protein
LLEKIDQVQREHRKSRGIDNGDKPKPHEVTPNGCAQKETVKARLMKLNKPRSAQRARKPPDRGR